MSPANRMKLLVLGIAAVAVGIAIALTLFKRHGAAPANSASSQVFSPLPVAPPPQTIRKEAPASVFGIVEDEEGNPIHGALLRTIQIASDAYQHNPHEVATAQTLEDGTYSIPRLLLNNRYRMTSSAPGFLTSSSQTFVLEKEQTEINFALAKDEPTDEADDKEPDSTEDEVKTIVAGAVASLDRIRSGRIVQTVTRIGLPINYSDEEIENELNQLEEQYRKQGTPEHEIITILEEARAYRELQRKGGSRTFECESIFEDGNFFTFIPLLPYVHLRRYIYNGKDTAITENPAEAGGEQFWVYKAVVDYAGGRNNAEAAFDVGLRRLFRFRDQYLTRINWRMSSIGEEDAETTYILEGSPNPNLLYTVKILPEKDYFIKEYKLSFKNNPSQYHIYRFSKPKWDAYARIYYPQEIIVEWHNIVKPGDDRGSVHILTVREAAFNIDIPDETFLVPFQKGLEVDDMRFDPPKHYYHKSPEDTDAYVEDPDKMIEALKSDK